MYLRWHSQGTDHCHRGCLRLAGGDRSGSSDPGHGAVATGWSSYTVACGEAGRRSWQLAWLWTPGCFFLPCRREHPLAGSAFSAAFGGADANVSTRGHLLLICATEPIANYSAGVKIFPLHKASARPRLASSGQQPRRLLSCCGYSGGHEASMAHWACARLLCHQLSPPARSAFLLRRSCSQTAREKNNQQLAQLVEASIERCVVGHAVGSEWGPPDWPARFLPRGRPDPCLPLSR